MIKTSIETINGKLCTVVRRPFKAECVREQLAMGIPVVAVTEDGWTGVLLNTGEFVTSLKNGDIISPSGIVFTHTIATLPALPKHPKPEHARLLYRYMAEGIHIFHESEIIDEGYGPYRRCWDLGKCLQPQPITHATDETGQRVDVAIMENE